MKLHILAASLLMLGLTACTGTENESAVTRAGVIDQQTLRKLMEEYPRLRAEPMPPPRPADDADPHNLPDRLKDARALSVASGEATFYAQAFEGRRTASGIPFRHNQLVAAHRAYPFGTILRVTNTRNDRSVNVRVVDRGPHGTSARARRTIIDLSRRAAQMLGFVQAGRTAVMVEVLEWGDGVTT